MRRKKRYVQKTYGLSIIEIFHITIHFREQDTQRCNFFMIFVARKKCKTFLIETNFVQKCNQSKEEKPEKQQLIIELKQIASSTHYQIDCERKAIETIQQYKDSRDFHNPVNLDVYIPEKQMYCYQFVKNIKLIGIPSHPVTFLVHYFERANGNTYSVTRRS